MTQTDTAKKLKIVLVDGSPLLREMLETIFRKLPDFEVVGVAHDLASLKPCLRSTEADWLVVTTMPNDHSDEAMDALRARYPWLRTLMLAADGSEVLANWLELRETHMESATLVELIAMMRDPGQNDRSGRAHV